MARSEDFGGKWCAQVTKIARVLFVGVLLQTSALASSRTSRPVSPRKPNVAIILLDDAGFAATSMYGGLAQTPRFEALAQTGIKYNRFHVAAICAPTRAALLSGRNPHQIGFGQIPETAARASGYTAVWPKSAASLAEHLRRIGYGTGAFGKWHNTPAAEWSPVGPFTHWPTGLGFDYFYGTMGTTSEFEPLLWRGTTSVDPPAKPEDGYNLTTDLVDDAIGWLHTRETLVPDTPYFMYFATTAVHSPHQVAEKWITPYRGKFSAGWDALRRQIFAHQKQMGLVPDDTALTPRDPQLPAWDSLSPDEKRVAERQMETLAGYMTQTDHEVGRLIDAIRRGPGGRDTLIIFIAGDNGSSGEDGPAGCDDCPQKPADPKTRLSTVSEIGGPGHIAGASAGWAFMNNTPFPGMKRQASHLGGLRTPLVISWPGHTTANDQPRQQWLNVTDIVPTIYDIIGYKPPKTIDGVRQIPLEGRSFAASLTKPSIATPPRTQYFETYGTRSIYQNGWFASLRYYVKPWGPIGNGLEKGADQWELYNLDSDFTQSRNLATDNPKKLKQMVALFDSEAKRNNVYPSGELHLWFDQLPSLTWKRTDLTFYPDAPGLSWDAMPDFSRAHWLEAHIDVPDDRVQGLIISAGMRGRGFALYMKDGRVIYEGQNGCESWPVETPDRIAVGTHKIRVDVSAGEFGTIGKRQITISVDGKRVTEGTVPTSIEPFYGSATLSVGRQHGSIVSPSRPLAFSGKIDHVDVHFLTP
jgi:arylsulfatase A-like enzyme